MRLPTERILDKLDSYLHKNDYSGAQRHLSYWLAEATAARDARTALLLHNERMGLHRKLGQEAEAIAALQEALTTVERLGVGEQVGAATTYLNAATVYKAFGQAEKGLPLFQKARVIYERELSPQDDRLAGLYNNMALALTDVGDYEQSLSLNRKALAIMESKADGAPEAAITYLNMASAAEAEHGLEAAESVITAYLDRARALLEGHTNRDGNYAFVCEKCASVFGYYGHFAYAKELSERATAIYERT